MSIPPVEIIGRQRGDLVTTKLETLRNQVQEFRELGLKGTAFRLKWEAKLRFGLTALLEFPLTTNVDPPVDFPLGIPFCRPDEVRAAVADRIPQEDVLRLRAVADNARQGKILSFSHWTADFGSPPDWHRNPETRARWNPDQHWSRSMRDGARVGDIKLTWEIGRFPHAYHLARSATLQPDLANRYGLALAEQVHAFVRDNPFARGIHWGSGQEIAFRLLAWDFATGCLFAGPKFTPTRRQVALATLEGAIHIERHIDYAIRAVHNNHLLSEALGLYLAGALFPGFRKAARWRRFGRALLEEHVSRQFYRDGGYIQQSHSYHRLALQVVLCAVAIARSQKEAVPEVWLNALARSVDFLVAQQNTSDGRLPNYGANDGGLPLVLSTCDYSDFRPTLQAASLASRGERIYAEGPWDEEAAWLVGPGALSAPLRPPDRVSVSFPDTGFHVLRGRHTDTFAVLRSGTIKDRFSQIDMLHLDVWWNGVNVLVDGGSYRYNEAPEWHNHFTRTASHNTMTVDGRDQMVHFRPFKSLYRTRARIVRFQDGPVWCLCEGEHFGYARYPGSPVHRRTALLIKDCILVVVDQVTGEGDHSVRLHWLCDSIGWRLGRAATSLELDTPKGMLVLRVFGASGERIRQDAVSGQTEPPRGWLSRYYGRKVPCVSSAVISKAPCPITLVSMLASVDTAVSHDRGEWLISTAEKTIRFRIGPTAVSSLVVEERDTP